MSRPVPFSHEWRENCRVARATGSAASIVRWYILVACVGVAVLRAVLQSFRRSRQLPRVIGIGSREKEQAFIARHRRFFQRLSSLLHAEGVVFNRTIKATDQADPIIFYMGIRTADDFMAVMQLAAFGFGLSAMALVRGMYERVVTAAFLAAHPQEATRFAEFDFVQRFKTAQQVKNTMGVFPEEQAAMDELVREYQRVKPQFEVPLCKKCGTTRTSVGWHRLDVVAMAHQVPPLSDIVVPAYYLPLGQAHATMRSISAYVKDVGGKLVFQRDQSAAADEMFKLAHLLLMHAFKIQAEHFKGRKLKKAVNQVIADYLAIWPSAERTGAA